MTSPQINSGELDFSTRNIYTKIKPGVESEPSAGRSLLDTPFEDWEDTNVEDERPFLSNLSIFDDVDFSGVRLSSNNTVGSIDIQSQANSSSTSLLGLVMERETWKNRTTGIAKLVKDKKGRYDNHTLDVYMDDSRLKKGNGRSFMDALYFKQTNISESLDPSKEIEAKTLWENETSEDSSLGSNSSELATTKENGTKNRYNGILKRRQLNTILTYFRCVIIVPVTISVISVVLSVAVFRDKNFVYKGKPLVISFNIFEGLKGIAYLIFRIVRLFLTGDSEFTWSSWYAQFFVYYVMWLPVSLGRIGILHNGLITLDRFFTVAFPLRRYNKRLVTCPKLCVVVIVVSMLLYQSAPLIIFFREVEPLIDYKKTFHTEEIISEIYVTNPAAFKTYLLVLTIGHALFVYIPLVLSLVFNTLTIVSLLRHQKRTQATLKDNLPGASSRAASRSQSMRGQSNIMIVVSSLVFSVLVLFRRVLPLVTLFVPEFGEGRKEMHLYILMNEIFVFFDCVSPLVNIISYSVLSSQFRIRLKKILWSSIHSSGSQTDLSSNNNTNSGLN
ncbi:hypothetical protein EGW08_011228 [Elysia chlorotica]|uniref:G-protein coupled receptors family 1 profile domain-containing protein n=1 Tax=Elysia chlorotica TaxID=188477 RepID=A0A433THK8_ELYCH|nr:hypothetical protein EGW08_011228 [Elysia chlorotica]